MCLSTCRLVIPIDLRAAKALPRNCGQAARGQKNAWRRGSVSFVFNICDDVNVESITIICIIVLYCIIIFDC